MQKWKRFVAALLAVAAMGATGSFSVMAKDGYLEKAMDDNKQQLYMLTSQSPSVYCMMITPDPDEREYLYQAAQTIVQGCKTDQQKTEAIYTWITDNLYYDWDGVENHSLPAGDPYSAYTTKVAVCEGFATLFAELMNAVGIPCVAFHGSSINDPLGITMDAVSSWDQAQYDDVDHAWNAAYVGGEWRYYDTTWDCASKKVNGELVWARGTKRYFGLTADKLGANHRTAYRINDEGAFKLIGGQWLFCDKNGNPFSGIWYDGYRSNLYYMQDGKPLTGRTVVDYQLIDFDEDGRYVRTLHDYVGWYQDQGDWYYIHNGIACYGWGYLGNEWYYLDPETSKMQTGWQWINGAWYYFSSSGAMQTGWVRPDGNWYYLNSSGAMAVGWKKVDGKWYYLNSTGAMAVGWKKLGDTWYYLTSSGAMATGWQWIGNHWYYFYSDGSMAANTTIDGYYLNNQGTY